MESNRKLLNPLLSWALFWLGAAASVVFVTVALAAYSSLQTVQTASTGSTLSSTEWNKVVSNLASVDSQLAALWALAYKSAVGSSDISDGTVWTADIANSAVTDAKIASGILPSKIAQSAATSGQVLKWNGSTWAPAADSTSGGASCGARVHSQVWIANVWCGQVWYQCLNGASNVILDQSACWSG